MAQPRYACCTCGTWVCARCGWKRSGASVVYRAHACRKCPSREGVLYPTMHTERMWRLHNDETSLPEPNVRPDPGDRTTSFGRRISKTGPEFYRGVRVPDTGPYSRLDVTSWKRGVDAALDSDAERST